MGLGGTASGTGCLSRAGWPVLQCVSECRAWTLCCRGIGHGAPCMESLQPPEPTPFHARFRVSQTEEAKKKRAWLGMAVITTQEAAEGQRELEGRKETG